MEANRRAPLDLKQAAGYLGVSVPWMRHAVRVRRIPYLKLGALLRFDPDDLDEFVRRSRVEAG